MYKTSQYFPKHSVLYSGRRKVELDLSNSATKADLEREAGVDTSK